MPADTVALLKAEIEQVIHDTWPEVEWILSAHQSERRSYSGITLPFAVLLIGAGTEGEWGITNIALERPIEIHYVMQWDDSDEGILPDKIGALKHALLAAAFSGSQASLLEIEDDPTPSSSLNATLYAKNLQLVGSTLRCKFVSGETAF
jgi:hypothetical protein